MIGLDAKELGAYAYRSGKARDTNPFRSDTEECADFDEGFDEAEKRVEVTDGSVQSGDILTYELTETGGLGKIIAHTREAKSDAIEDKLADARRLIAHLLAEPVGDPRNSESIITLETCLPYGFVAWAKKHRQALAAVGDEAKKSEGGERTAPLSCPDCHDETDCANVDICRAVEEVYHHSSPTADRREIVARALMEKWPGDYAWGDETREPNELAFETADAILAALDGGVGE